MMDLANSSHTFLDIEDSVRNSSHKFLDMMDSVGYYSSGDKILGTMDSLPYLVLCLVMGVLGGVGVGLMHATFEHFWYHVLDWLHRRGWIQRLAPQIVVTQNQYRVESFWATALGPIPVSAAAFYLRDGFRARMQFSGDMMGSLAFTWTVMVLHDAYFFLVHTLMHRVKTLYRRVHQWHHATHGDVTVFSTAVGDVLDVTLTFAPFYAALAAFVYLRPAWNPLDVLCLMWAVNGVDMMGHSGFALPMWVYAPGSLGVLLTPGAQRPRHHFIHHLDPRFNRSLYFTWWDRLAGSFQEDHPKILPSEHSKILTEDHSKMLAEAHSEQVSKAAHDKKTLLENVVQIIFRLEAAVTCGNRRM